MSRSARMNSRMRHFACCSADTLFRELDTAREGLRQEQAERRSTAGKRQKGDTLLYRLRRAFVNPFTLILTAIALISLVTDVFLASNFSRNITTFLIILTMILLSGAIRLVQELRARRQAEQLERLVRTTVTVRRGGILAEVSGEQLVAGDVVCLAAGDRVPADLRLIATTDLFVSQSAITGESGIVEKDSRISAPAEEGALTQLSSLVFQGSAVISGKGEGVVLAVGEDTLYGGVGRPERERYSAFDRGERSIALVMVRFMAVLVPAVFLVSGLTGGSWLESFVFALSVAVGLTPEMLPTVMAACLARGSGVLSGKKAIVKNLSAMQGLGSMDVLCMDKTGTLTRDGLLLEYYMDVLGRESGEVLDWAYLNSLFHSGVRNPIDSAVLACGRMPGREEHFAGLARQWRKVDEVPFDFGRKCVSTLVEDREGRRQLVVKGDVEQVAARCRFVAYRGQILPAEDAMDSVRAVVDEMLEDGMKVIAVARRSLEAAEPLSQAQERELTLLGYLAFFDGPRPSAAQSAAALKTLQVGQKILTGDQAAVAVSVCRRVGISTDRVLTGAAISAMTDEELEQAAEETAVFAELTPGQKVRIIAALRKNGHTVGFLGDGLNDVPALWEADVGVSVENAVEAARDAADVVLLEKDLGVLEEAILEGRRTFVNMRKYIKITASSNFGNILSIVCASALLPFLPMTAIQLLLLNLLYDALCIALPFDRVDGEELKKPGVWGGRGLGRFMLSFGPISSLLDLAAFAFLYFLLCPALCGGPFAALSAGEQARFVSLFQTGWFLESMWTQVMILYLLRSRRAPLLQSRPSGAVAAVTLTGVVLFTAMTFTPLAALLGLGGLPPAYFAFLAAAVALYLLMMSLAKARYIRTWGELI